MIEIEQPCGCTLPVRNPQQQTFVISKTWECENPLGKCFYNVVKDPMMDECLVCGDPSERK
jgi:hypothetical protein